SDDSCDLVACSGGAYSICNTNTNTCVASNNPNDNCDVTACSGGTYSTCDTSTRTCVASNNPDDVCDVTACSGGTYSTCDTSTRTCVASNNPNDNCDVTACSGGTYSTCDTSTRTCVASNNPNDNCDVTACSGGTYSTCDTNTNTCVASNNPNDNCDVTACSEDENTPPIVDGLQADDGPYCTGIPGAGIAKFSWRYSDDYGDQQSFSLQISTDDNFDNIVVSRSSLGSAKQQSVFVTTNPSAGKIMYNTPYYWRVKAWDQDGLDSGWVHSSGTYTYGYPHPAPVPLYTISDNPVLNEPVEFTDVSWCYGGLPCKDLLTSETCTAAADRNCYTWNFGDRSPLDYTPGNTSHIYTNKGAYASGLWVCDDIGCCSYSRGVNVRSGKDNELPWWKEISPF
ncbi:MAG: PKD domain-containing protein, partial [Candidatus Staskawiczbacteria bacterium]|nr:PKD domain-containing protein [Candidatus Staskawiczbacteria bacterium]